MHISILLTPYGYAHDQERIAAATLATGVRNQGDYAKGLVKYLQQKGDIYIPTNPGRTELSQEEIVSIAFGHVLEQKGNETTIIQMMSLAPVIQLIELFDEWYKDQLLHGIRQTGGLMSIYGGVKKLLLSQGHIIEKNNVIEWKQGQPPQSDSIDLYNLVAGFNQTQPKDTATSSSTILFQA